MNKLTTTSRLSLIAGLSAALLAAPAMSSPGKGWDTLNIGQGDNIHTAAFVGTALGGSAGKGFDVFNVGAGEPLPAAGQGYMGTAHGGSAGQGWDVLHVGQGDKL